MKERIYIAGPMTGLEDYKRLEYLKSREMGILSFEEDELLL